MRFNRYHIKFQNSHLVRSKAQSEIVWVWLWRGFPAL